MPSLSTHNHSPTVLFLGTGTSTGVPLIGCSCSVCTSTDSRDNRLRSSVLVQYQEFTILIDTTPDFRQQALRYQFPRIDAVLITHGHVDHIFGLDDIRRFNTVQGERIPVYSSAPTREILNRTFYYLSSVPFPGGYLPQLDFHDIQGTLTLGPFSVTPIPVEHGNDLTWGYKITTGEHSLAYIPDCARIPDTSIAFTIILVNLNGNFSGSLSRNIADSKQSPKSI